MKPRSWIILAIVCSLLVGFIGGVAFERTRSAHADSVTNGTPGLPFGF